MIANIEEFTIPEILKNIPNPPKKLYIRGNFPKTEKYLCVVGSRKNTSYGHAVCEQLIKEISNYSLTIVSGLAIGIDTASHLAAIDNNLATVAFPGSGLNDEVIAPSSHLKIAHKIIEKGGCLISEYESNFSAQNWTFPERNRLMAGISDAILVIEAKPKSGTLITAMLALDYNKTLMAVPGSIFSLHSGGPNYLIRLGATPIRCGEDIIDALEIKKKNKNSEKLNIEDIIQKLRETSSVNELLIISKLDEPRSKDELVKLLNLSIGELNTTLTLLELKDIIEEKVGKIYLKIFA